MRKHPYDRQWDELPKRLAEKSLHNGRCLQRGVSPSPTELRELARRVDSAASEARWAWAFAACKGWQVEKERLDKYLTGLVKLRNGLTGRARTNIGDQPRAT